MIFITQLQLCKQISIPNVKLVLIIGVKSVIVALISGKAEVHYNPDVLNSEQITSKISDLGFGATLMDDGTGDGTAELTVRNVMII